MDISNNSSSNEGSKELTRINLIRASNVEKTKKIPLDDDHIFQFECKEEDNFLCFELSEIDALAPFTYQAKMTEGDMIKKHKIFKSCDNLKEAEININKLFEKGKVKLSPGDDEDELKLTFISGYMSGEVDFDIPVKKVMTRKTKEMLIKLYKIEKYLLKGMKEIQKDIKNGNVDGKKIVEKIKDIKENINEE